VAVAASGKRAARRDESGEVHVSIGPILKDGIIREVEVSITARCTLACRDCGFLVPHQPPPAHGDPVDELVFGLEQLRRCGIHIGSLALLGGEPTIDAALLTRAAERLADVDVTKRIEVVSNGLTPQGLSPEALERINRFTISDYGYEVRLLDLWREWIGLVAPHVEFVPRSVTGGWDAWEEAPAVPRAKAQAMYDGCWYRKHCVTIERGQLFACSRIPKLLRDGEGLPLTHDTTAADVESHLHRPEALPSCATCTPMMGLPTVPAGQQPDDRIPRLQRRAIVWLANAIDQASAKTNNSST